jgi:septum formation protein
MASGLDETTSPGQSPSAAVLSLAIRKAESVAQTRTKSLVLAADTVIDFQGTLLGKPVDDAHAKEMLQLLRGRTHAVLTGIAVVGNGETVKLGRVVSTEVRMRSYSESEIEAYVESGEPMGKAGSYAIQGDGSQLIESTRGCYNNVVGLPLCETVMLLKTAGVPFAGDRSICQLPSGEPCPRVG